MRTQYLCGKPKPEEMVRECDSDRRVSCFRVSTGGRESSWRLEHPKLCAAIAVASLIVPVTMYSVSGEPEDKEKRRYNDSAAPISCVVVGVSRISATLFKGR